MNISINIHKLDAYVSLPIDSDRRYVNAIFRDYDDLTGLKYYIKLQMKEKDIVPEIEVEGKKFKFWKLSKD